MARATQTVETTKADTILATMVGHGDQTLMIRERVRKMFDEALFSTRSFEQALVVLFTRGIETGMDAKPKRARKKPAGNGARAAEGDDARA